MKYIMLDTFASSDGSGSLVVSNPPSADRSTREGHELFQRKAFGRIFNSCYQNEIPELGTYSETTTNILRTWLDFDKFLDSQTDEKGKPVRYEYSVVEDCETIDGLKKYIRLKADEILAARETGKVIHQVIIERVTLRVALGKFKELENIGQKSVADTVTDILIQEEGSFSSQDEAKNAVKIALENIGEMTILQFTDPRYGASHLGRNKFATYCQTESDQLHETFELLCQAVFAVTTKRDKSNRMSGEEALKHHELGNWYMHYINGWNESFGGAVKAYLTKIERGEQLQVITDYFHDSAPKGSL